MDTPVLNNSVSEPCFDPYDLWSTRSGVYIKRKYYSGAVLGKAGAVVIGLIDWLLPNISRTLVGARKRLYPIVVAQEIQLLSVQGNISNHNAELLLNKLLSVSCDPSGQNGWSWGLGFPWMSKNGLYPDSLPFITHTPYAMEALLELRKEATVKNKAITAFNDTWNFLESLLIMYHDDNQLALSYAPVDEPRIVVNANSYAAYAYALHAVNGKVAIQNDAIIKSQKLINWVLAQQNGNGSWYYYADKDSGNFIDCFHSCFVMKNLLKAKKLLHLNDQTLDHKINLGWAFIKNSFYDKNKGLCQRFTERDIKDPFIWDLYDQAEYLGLLIDFDLYKEAQLFYTNVLRYFQKDNDLYSRIDFMNIKWGKGFNRWGVVPFLYNADRLTR